MRNGWSDPLALGGGDTNLYVYAGSGPTDFTDPFGLQRYDAAPQPKTQKVTAGCMGARLLENFFGSTGYPTVTVALNVAAVAVLKPAIAALVPGPGWLYTTTAVGYDLPPPEKLRQTWAALAPSKHKTHYVTSPHSAKPRSNTVMLTTAAIVHIKASVAFTASIASEVRRVILVAVRTDITVNAPNTRRSATKGDL